MTEPSARERLTEAQWAAVSHSLPDWQRSADGRALCRRWQFADFAQAWAFLSAVATLAEAANHHPDWSNSYGRVDICLTSHDLGGLSPRDLSLARAIDALSLAHAL